MKHFFKKHGGTDATGNLPPVSGQLHHNLTPKILSNWAKRPWERWVTMFLLVVLIGGIGGWLGACTAVPEQPSAPAVATITIENFAEPVYATTATLDFKTLSVTVNYTDQTSDTLDQYLIDATPAELAAVPAETQFILYTDGLAAQAPGALREGEYNLSCLLLADGQTYPLGTVKISDSMAYFYDLTYFGTPTSLMSYYNTVAAVEEEPEAESSFKEKPEYYAVGADNEYILRPKVTLIQKEPRALVSDQVIRVDVAVYDVTTDLPVGSEIYTFNPETYGFAFTPAAIGHVYRLEMIPRDWATDNYGHALTPIQHTVQVCDGWNAYTAGDLARINLYDGDIAALHPDYRTCAAKVFYNPTTKNYEERNTAQLWRRFLAAQGATDLHEIHGLFLHNDLAVLPGDLPEDFFVTAAESAYAAGSLRDYVFLYQHYLTDHDFVLNGNCFKIDFKALPVGLSTKGGPGLEMYTADQSTYTPGHSAAFALIYNPLDQAHQPVGTLQNLETFGNTNEIIASGATANEQTEALKASGGLIMIKSIYGRTVVTNNLVKSFMIGLYMEGPKTADGQGLLTMEAQATRVYDCFNSGAFSFGSDGNIFQDVEMKRFGGPCVITISLKDNASGGLTVTDDCVLESLINGTEPWFDLQGATTLATNITGNLNALVTPYGKTLLNQQATEAANQHKINLMAVALDSGYLTSSHQQIHAHLTQGTTAFRSEDPILQTYLTNTGRQTPILQTATQVAYAGTDGLYQLPQRPFAEQLAGDTLFVLNPAGSTTIGLMLQLYDLPVAA